MLALAAALALAHVAPLPTPPRDPFRPYVEEVGGACEEVHAAACAAVDDVRVAGIVSGTATPRAMVELKNGKSLVLRVGDVFVGGRIKAIRRDGIVVEHIAWSQVDLPKRTLMLIPLGA